MQKKSILLWVGLLILLVIAAAVLATRDGSQQAAEEAQASGEKPAEKQKSGAPGNPGPGGRPVTVKAETVKTHSLQVFQTGLGTVTSQGTVTVRSRVDGQLVRVLFQEGQLVKAGDLLAEIDPRPFQAQLAQVEGQALRNAALLENAKADLERYKVLHQQDSIAQQQVDAQKSLVQQYEGTVIADQGQVSQAKLQLSFTRITAPITGRIGLRQIDNGNNITTADAITVINQLQPISVVFTVPEDKVSHIAKRLHEARKAGRQLSVEAWDKGNRTLLTTGALSTIDNQIDSATGTIKLKAQFSNEESNLFPNQFVNVRLQLDVLQDALVIPSAAIQHGSSGSFVYKVSDENTVTVQPIVTGTTENDKVGVLEGLQVGNVIVTSGLDKLRDGAKVNIEGARPDGSGHAGNGRGKQSDSIGSPQDRSNEAALRQAAK